MRVRSASDTCMPQLRGYVNAAQKRFNFQNLQKQSTWRDMAYAE